MNSGNFGDVDRIRGANSINVTEIPDPRRRWSGLALAATGAVGFSGKAIVAKLLYRHGLDAIAVLYYRMLFALPLFVALAWWGGRGQPALTPEDKRRVVLLGACGYYLASLLDFLGLEYISAGLERLILYLNPTLVLALGFFLYKQRVSGRQIAAMGVSYAGVLVVFGREAGHQGPHAALGAMLVLASAVSYAIYLTFSGAMVQRVGSLRLVGLASTVAAVFCIVQYFLLRPLDTAFAAPPAALALSVLNATLCTVAPVLMVMMAIERVGAPLAAQAGLIGPMSTLLMGAVILGEPFTAVVAAGTALVLAGVWLLARCS